MKETIKTYILDKLLGGRGEIEISATDDILSSGLIDSMGVMQLITFIETQAEIKVPPEDMVIENFITIDAIDNYIKIRQNL